MLLCRQVCGERCDASIVGDFVVNVDDAQAAEYTRELNASKVVVHYLEVSVAVSRDVRVNEYNGAGASLAI